MIYKPLCIWSKRIIVHELQFRDVLIDEYKVTGHKIQTVYHGVEHLKTIQREVACKSLHLDFKKDNVLFMGYLTGYKDIDLLIEGFSKYSALNKNAYLIIGAGKHPKYTHDEKYLEEYRRLKLKANRMIDKDMYRWVGFIPEEEIITYYSASDVSVYPYTICMSSSGPMAIALGCNKPFLASKYFADLLPDKKLLFDNSAGSFAEKLNDFFLNKKKFQLICSKMRDERMWEKVGKITYDEYRLLFRK
jgi:glycosyltransferase involved in cell wall biosynthesis